jgi:hypothetical protein
VQLTKIGRKGMKRMWLGFILSAVSLSAATINVVPSAATAMIGETIGVDINISGAADLYAFQFDFMFAPGVLKVSNPSDVTDGLFLASGGFFSGFRDNDAGVVTFIADSLIGPVPGKSGSGTLARITFVAAGTGKSAIRVTNPILLDSNLTDIPVQLFGSDVNVIPEPSTMSLMGLTTAMAFVLTRHRRRR